MTDSVFVDTNILLYARDASEPEKQAIAAARLAELWETRCGRLSVQVLNEFFVNATRKLDPGLSPEEAWDDVEALFAWNPLPIDMPVLNRTYAVQRRYELSWWDSMIVAAAEAAGCSRILSEDLSPETSYFGVAVENPFVVPAE
ncbi:PIN domain-containing protein [Haloferula sp. A504]|uniref:PIN domain-containing protein n=1 Tax=Haloferula sp. A504 TaxID=3373601 RepID=UPI0031C4D52A|nr:PIN domain-containing protein [Verrucomicrobiaceae bacterium E54]